MGYDIDQAIDEELDDDQARVVTHDDGDLAVLAGPGAGKTRCMEHRVAHVLERDDIHPRQIAAVGFTNESSDELCRRIAKLHPSGGEVVAKTLHSLCYMILRNERGVDDVAPDWKANKAIGGIFADVGWDFEDPPSYVHGLFDMVRGEGIDRPAIPDTLHDWKPELGEQLVEVWKAYESEMLDEGVVDFMGMIYRTAEVLETDEEVRDRVRRQFRHLVVDECQDLDPLQLDVVGLIGGHDDCDVCLVGDVNQSIYGFRGADVDRLGEFIDERGMDVLHLRRNYRSAPKLVEATNRLMDGRAPGGIEAPAVEAVRDDGGTLERHEFVDDLEEAEWVADDIESQIEAGAHPADIGVLYRTNAQCRFLQIEMAYRGLPFSIVRGRGFFEQSEVEDALAYLRLARDASDLEALERIYSTPTRYLGGKFLDALADEHRGDESVFDAMRRVQAGGYKNEHCIGYLLDDLRPILDDPGQDPAEALDYVYQLRSRVEDTETFRSLNGGDQEGDSFRQYNLDALRDLAERFESVEAMLDKIMGGDMPSEQGGRGGGRIQMMTVHRSKGLEFQHVYVVGMTDGVLPHMKGIFDEERRIAYVAATRAEDRLVLTSPLSEGREAVSPYVAEMYGG